MNAYTTKFQSKTAFLDALAFNRNLYDKGLLKHNLVIVGSRRVLDFPTCIIMGKISKEKEQSLVDLGSTHGHVNWYKPVTFKNKISFS